MSPNWAIGSPILLSFHDFPANYSNSNCRPINEPFNRPLTTHSGFTDDPAGRNEIELLFPRLELISPYQMDGRVLILPVQGNGNSNLTLLNSESTIKFTGKPVEKNGKVYMQTDNLKFSVQPQKMIVEFGNMFNGDPVLGPTTNQFLNENWADIYAELRVSVEAAFSKVIETVINNVFASLQYKNAFAA